MAFFSTLFLFITIIRADALLPLNKMWLRFGLLLGLIVSPIVLGVIFFGMFTPITVLMRMSGRDELRLKKRVTLTYWVTEESGERSPESFNNQF